MLRGVDTLLPVVPRVHRIAGGEVAQRGKTRIEGYMLVHLLRVRTDDEVAENIDIIPPLDVDSDFTGQVGIVEADVEADGRRRPGPVAPFEDTVGGYAGA